MEKQQKVWINLGSGYVLAKNFINVDKYLTVDKLKIPEGAEFIQADLAALPFEDNYADYIESIDVIEHIPFRQVIQVFKEMYRVIKPGSKVCLFTTNFDQLADLWSTNIKGKSILAQEDMNRYVNLMEVIYGNQVHDGELHRTPFNPPFLMHMLLEAGFEQNKIQMYLFPMHSSKYPPMRTREWPKDRVMRTEMIWTEIIK